MTRRWKTAAAAVTLGVVGSGLVATNTNPVRTRRINLKRVEVNSGWCMRGIAWRNNGNGTWTDVGNTCTPIV